MTMHRPRWSLLRRGVGAFALAWLPVLSFAHSSRDFALRGSIDMKAASIAP